MPPDSIWSSPFNKSENKLNSEEVRWKNFMNECLKETQIFKKYANENEKYLSTDPKFVMDVRHRMVKQSAKIISLPQLSIHSEALKILRMENHNRLLRQKEEKMVEKEIAKLKQTLDNHRLFTKIKINETANKRTKSSNRQKFSKHAKIRKTLAYNDGTLKADPWQNQCAQMSREYKNTHNVIPYVKLPLKIEERLDELSETISIQRGSITDEHEPKHKEQSYEINDGKNEIMKRFFKKDTVQPKHKLQNNVTAEDKIREYSEIQNSVNRKRIEKTWETWKAFIQKIKSRKREKKIYTNKIEAFLMSLKGNEIRKEKTKQLRGIVNLKQETETNLRLKNRTRERDELMNAEEEREGRLKKLMQEVKSSQTEARRKLQEMTSNSPEVERKYPNAEFLKKMEKRREERLKRRQEIQEKKRKMEEEREKAKREKEEEKRRQEEEYKRKNLQELKEKRKLEKERKEEEKKKREKLRVNLRLAEDHYEKYMLRTYGLGPWTTLMKIRILQNQRALTFFERRLKEKIFRKWTADAREQMALRAIRAAAFYEKVLKSRCLSIWVQFHKETMKQDQVAVDWNEFKITERAFKIWQHFTEDERMDYLNKKNAARLNYERKLKMKFFTRLRGYPKLKQQEHAKEIRKRKWRQKVREILPDYKPVDVSECF